MVLNPLTLGVLVAIIPSLATASEIICETALYNDNISTYNPPNVNKTLT